MSESTTRRLGEYRMGLDPQGPPLVIVGTDRAALEAARHLRQRGYLARIQLFGDRPYAAQEQALLTAQQAELQLEYHEMPIIGVDRGRQTVVDLAGVSHRYQALILATGVRPKVPGIPGIGLNGVHLFHQLEQMAALLKRLRPGQPLVVVGGGLLGMSLAAGLALNGCSQIELLQQEERLAHTRLDDGASAVVSDYLLQLGVRVHCNAGVVEVLGNNGKVEGVRLRDGTIVPTQTVIFATGIKPNTQVALAAQLKTARGVVVDDQMRTSVPNIYAVGACAEHRGVLHGLADAGAEQAAVAAAHLLGESVQYVGTTRVNQVRIGDLLVFSHGDTAELRQSPLLTQLTYTDEPRRIYRKLVVLKGRLVGAIAIGPLAERARLEEAIAAERPIRPWRQWRFLLTGTAWPVRQRNLLSGPSDTLVCACRGITSGMLAEGDDVARQVGNVCGGCLVREEEMAPALTVTETKTTV